MSSDLFTTRLGRRALRLGLLAFKLGATLFEHRDILRRRQRRLALGQQEIAPVPGAHFDLIADVPEVLDLFQQDDVPLSSRSSRVMH